MKVTVVFFSGEVMIWEGVKTLTVKEGRLEAKGADGVGHSVALFMICTYWAVA